MSEFPNSTVMPWKQRCSTYHQVEGNLLGNPHVLRAGSTQTLPSENKQSCIPRVGNREHLFNAFDQLESLLEFFIREHATVDGACLSFLV